ncbi:amylo-alpha-1,6-glucosidase [Nonomuraea sp. K274]|uniref:Amylo-alpha-1,6-glucosidase n=1 Tax=Nonomuraea cypriaca TaxID=1187855 RepID=A0A931AL81_9ACTN|nr:glycogen debranching N-terminal domain-containing protein [Nonomuraea cypriaca]MBF8193830.1 amylo-alpha-1,6-glucosidase [Nonomuraea cypriaca]
MDVKTPEETGQEPGAEAGLQPFLHDSCITMHAPSFTASRPDGQLSHGADGFYHGERRALARLEISADRVLSAPVAGGLEGADRALFRTVLRGVAETTADPAVVLERRRTTAPGRLTESLRVLNSGRVPALIRLSVAAGTDLATMEQVKSGVPVASVAAEVEVTGSALVWAGDAVTVRLASSPAPTGIEAGARQGRLHYDIALAPGEDWKAELVCTAEDAEGEPFPAPATEGTPWRTPRLRSADRRFDDWLHQSHADLRRLLLADPDQREDVFLAAGAPWFATLFGRDSLWAARMLLPLGTDLAASTLRVLARRQGKKTDVRTQEQPGKILHEVRRAGLRLPGHSPALPPVYYGTVDATPLWITLLHDAWRWGLDPAEVEALLPHAESALAWMSDHGDADGDGFLEYIDESGRGLANQGWKDSGDSIRFRDGRLAEPPIALCEVQAYAYEAAHSGAALLRAFDRPGADRWEEWAARLKSRFHTAFWVEDDRGPYPAVALDRDKRPADAVTSGFGHLLGTGLLDYEESALLAKRLAGPDLDSGFGLRTLSSDSGGFNPLGYHIGSVWPHDTAIAVFGLTRAGFSEAATSLAAGLIRAAGAFDARLPELFGGYGTDAGRRPVPYPAACRPQAWAATSSVLVLQSLLGLSADVPNGTLTVASQVSADLRPLRASGLEIAGGPLEITVAADGTADVQAPAGLTVRVTP